MRRRRIRRPLRCNPPSRPWTPEEDAQLHEINRIGLVDDLWHFAIPDRTLHEMYDRRLELGIRPAELI